MHPIPTVSLIDLALDYLGEVVEICLNRHFGEKDKYLDWSSIPVPALNGTVHPFHDFLRTHRLSPEAYIVLLMALVPHIKPHFYDHLFKRIINEAGDFPQLGGVRGKQHRGFLPTAETALFMLAGEDLESRFKILELFSSEHLFAKNQILWLESPPSGEPMTSGRLVMSQEYIDLFTLGKISKPRFGMNFPARYLETNMDWQDLVLNPTTLKQIEELKAWVQYSPILMHQIGMSRTLKPGYRALFHGPPGTGKTLTASLIGKYTGKAVYKIDLSMLVSKYIGETEKNLANLFAKAENKDWILFFDEADALFGKRTNVRDAHDKYANQEVSYLLQRVETYDGLVILASNLRSNIDDAFVRRFQSIIHFPMPSYAEREQLWRKASPKKLPLATDIDVSAISQRYNLSGAGIMNIIQYCCINALANGEQKITKENLDEGIKREFVKEGKLL